MNTDDEMQKILDKANRGDKAAFESLILPYEKLIYSVAYRMMQNREDAFDMAQESLIKIYKNIEKCVEIGSFKSWACTITTNTCLDELRKRKRKKEESLNALIETEDGAYERQTRSEEPEPPDILLSKEQLTHISEAVESLPYEYRAVVVLREINGLSYQEVSYALSVSIGTVKSRIFRARSLLKKFLLQTGTNTGENRLNS